MLMTAFYLTYKYVYRQQKEQIGITSLPSLREKNEWMDSSSFWPFFTRISFAMSNRRGRENGVTVRTIPLREKQKWISE